ncbi:MAG: 4Fe-4S dicluster domain-containing protein [Planctomycetes bacterium]|nr:4Fe-4S dicluster domain-containing protein [Planctomycetota bacterium]
MPVRNLVKIDERKCDGCGLCIVDCPEGALAIIDGKARVVRESLCDGLGACLGACPQGAITIEQREAEAFDEQAVERHRAETAGRSGNHGALPIMNQPAALAGCPGARTRQFQPPSPSAESVGCPSQLSHWPVQLALVPPNAPFLHQCDLLLAADCVPFAMADFHARFLRGRPVVVGCPKLDDTQAYVAKLHALLRQSSVNSLTVIHMEVPCCSGLCRIAWLASEGLERRIPIRDVTISLDGRVVSE